MYINYEYPFISRLFPSRCFGSCSSVDWQVSWLGNSKMGGLRNTVSSKPKLIVELKIWPVMPAKDAPHAPKSCSGKAVLFTFTLIYGMYWLLNLVTGNEGDASAVLIRGIEGCSGTRSGWAKTTT